MASSRQGNKGLGAMVSRIHAVLLGLLLLFLSACSQAPITTGTQAAAATTATAAETRNTAEYRLGATDKLRITVFGEESLSGEFVVSNAGYLSLPLIGDVQAGGLTVPELQRSIETKLAAGFLKQPRVSAEVLNYRPFYILGEVNKPGEYPYTSGLTVVNAVARAEGFTYRADTRRVYIKRANSTSEQEFSLTTTLPVEPGDTIRVKERFF
jgi:protein involved in polysaccharide export with SLBB domain